MTRLISKLALVCVLCLPVGGMSALAAEGKTEEAPVDLNAFLCKDVMRMTSEDRTIAISVMHGYVLGKKGATTFVSSVLGEVTDQFLDYCLDHPTEKALPSFEKLAK